MFFLLDNMRTKFRTYLGFQYYFLTELVQITIERKKYNIQIIADDFNDLNKLCFCKLFVILVILHL